MKKILFAVFTALAFVGCQQMQSELNFSEIKGKGSVTGKVLYEEVFTTETGSLESRIVPAVGVDVVLEVANAAYTSGAEGIRKYVAVTDSTGAYIIKDIPVGQRDIDGVRVQGPNGDPIALIRPRPFLASEVDSIYYVFTDDFVPVKISANTETRLEDIALSLEESALKNRATIKGKVVYDYGDVKDGNAYATSFRAAANVEVVAEFTDPDSKTQFVAKTNNDGEYQMTILVESTDAEIRLYARSFAGHHSEEVGGEIKISECYYTTETPNIVTKTVKAEDVVLAEDIVMTHTAEDLRYAGTVTGKVVYEYGIVEVGGAYEIQQKPAANAEVKISYTAEDGSLKEINVKSDAEGQYKFVVPLKATDEASISVSPREYRALYSHVEAGEIVVDSASYHFTSATGEGYVLMDVRREQVTFAKDLVLVAENADKDGAATLSGVVMFDAGYIEKGLNTGEFEVQHLPAVGAEVVVNVDGGKEYTVKTDANGAYKISIPAPLGKAQFDVDVTVNEYRDKYSKYDDNESTIVADSAVFQSYTTQHHTLIPKRETVASEHFLLEYSADIIDAKSAAILSGKVLYEAGYKEVSAGNYEVQQLPASRAEVIVRLSSGKEYTVKTDAKGAYKISIPAPAGQSSFDVEVSVKEYHSHYSRYNDETLAISLDSAFFQSYTTQNHRLTVAKELVAEDAFLLEYMGDVIDTEGAVVLSGIVLYESGYVEKGAGQYEVQTSPAPKAEVVVNVVGKEYTMKTDAKGAYKITIPVPTGYSSFDADVRVNEYRALYNKYNADKHQLVADSAIFNGVSIPTLTGLKAKDVKELDELVLTHQRDIITKEEGDALLRGFILYDAGYKEVSVGNYEVQQLPAKGVEVTVETFTWDGYGYVQDPQPYTIKTDAKGAYQLKFPVPSDGMKRVFIKVDEEFQAPYTYYNNDSARLVVEDRLFDKFAGIAYEDILPAQDTLVNDIILQNPKQLPSAEKEGPATVYGRILFEAGYSLDETGSSYIKQPLPAAGVRLLVEIGSAKHWLTTDKEGIYRLVVPMKKGETKTAYITEIKEFDNIYTDNMLAVDSFHFNVPVGLLPVNKDLAVGDSAIFDDIELLKDPYPIVAPLAASKRDKKVTITGIITRDAEKSKTDPAMESTYKNGEYYIKDKSVAEKEIVYVVISGDIRKEDGSTETKEFIYKTTAINGEYKVIANVYDTWLLDASDAAYTPASYTVKVEEEKNSSLTHYYYRIDADPTKSKWLSESITGTFSSVTSATGTINSYDKDTENNTIKVLELQRTFTIDSEAKKTVHGIGNDCDYEDNDPLKPQLYRSENPFGW